MIRLYSLPVSSYSAKVRIALRAKGLEFEEVAPPGGYSSAEYQSIIPAATIPAIDHDGFLIWDSEAILEYLEEVFPEPAMLPADAKDRACVRALARFHDTRLEPALRALFAEVAPQTRNAESLTKSVELLHLRLAQFVAILEKTPFYPGETLMLCDCGYAVSFEIMDGLRAAIGFEDTSIGVISAYRARLLKQPAVFYEMAHYREAIVAWARSRIEA